MELRTASKLDQAAAAVAEPTDRYDKASIALHWLTAWLVSTLWVLGQCIDFFPRGTPRIAARSTHITLGVVLLVVLLVRVIWRSTSGRRLPMAVSGWLGVTAKVIHYGLYVLVALAVGVGIFTAWVRGDNIFGLFTIPKYDPSNPGLREIMGERHEFLANAVLIVAGLHALAALAHHFVLKDSVLRRMMSERNG
jgi:cytochrome b561